jgi:hypothetical protein
MLRSNCIDCCCSSCQLLAGNAAITAVDDLLSTPWECFAAALLLSLLVVLLLLLPSTSHICQQHSGRYTAPTHASTASATSSADAPPLLLLLLLLTATSISSSGTLLAIAASCSCAPVRSAAFGSSLLSSNTTDRMATPTARPAAAK